ncbi:uncharacterized protein DS421_19g659360 [Arachis hypogaea]|uniref:Uncharacterized protein n=1 Tax=Arachis hypogaea TaxID=3818 RepID=A0A6B9VBZ3_ARAHY|nr:uncharacterized protein DS421_19g659360 [Arachis hypogaea]
MCKQHDARLSVTQVMSSCVGCLPAPDITRAQVPDMAFQMHQCAYKSILMAARGRGRGRRGANHAEEPTRGADAFIAAMNTMAEAVRETKTATTRAIDRLGERNGDRNGGRNGERGGDGNDNEGAGNHDNPMTLATFLKVNPPKFKGTLVTT